MIKRMCAALLAAAILLCASGCSPKRESAQAVVEQAINAVQEMDTEAMPAYWGGSLLDDALTSEDADADAAYTAEMLDLRRTRTRARRPSRSRSQTPICRRSWRNS